MANVTAYQCDRCESIISAKERVKRLLRFQGASVSGEIKSDLCPDCAIREAEPLRDQMRPVSTRKKAPAESGEQD